MSANLWGFYRIRKTDGLIMIRCEHCGTPCFYNPDSLIAKEQYTDRNGAEWVRPLIITNACTVCNSRK